MRMGLRGLGVLAGVCLAPLASAQEQRSEEQQVQPPAGIADGRGAAGTGVGQVPPPPGGPTEATVQGRFRPPTGAGPSTARVAQARLLSSQDGAARLRFPDGEELVRRGSVIGGDVVKSVQGRQILLDRSVAGDPGGEGLVVVTFGADGRPRVRVFWTKNPKAAAPPEVK